MPQESNTSVAYQQAAIQSAGEMAVKKRIEELKQEGTLKTLEDLKQEKVLSNLFAIREAAMVVVSAIMRSRAQGLPDDTGLLFIKRFKATLHDKRCPHCGAYISYVDFARIPGEDWYGAFIQPCNHRLYQEQGGQR